MALILFPSEKFQISVLNSSRKRTEVTDKINTFIKYCWISLWIRYLERSGTENNQLIFTLKKVLSLFIDNLDRLLNSCAVFSSSRINTNVCSCYRFLIMRRQQKWLVVPNGFHHSNLSMIENVCMTFNFNTT